MYWHESTTDGVRRAGRDEGFTLVEGLVVLLIVSITALLAIPNLQRVKIKTETTQAVSRIAGYVDRARSEAIKRHSPVCVAFGDPAISGNLYFRVFEDWDPSNADVGTNGDGKLNGVEQVIYTELISHRISVMGTAPLGDTDTQSVLLKKGDYRTWINYRSDGSLAMPANVVGAGAAYFRDEVGNFFRLRINSVTGAPRVSKFLPNKKWSPKKEDWEWEY